MDSSLNSNGIIVLVPAMKPGRQKTHNAPPGIWRENRFLAAPQIDLCLALMIALITLYCMRTRMFSLSMNGFLATDVALIWLACRATLKLDRLVSSLIAFAFLLHPQVRLAIAGETSSQWNILLMPLLVLVAPTTWRLREMRWAWILVVILGVLSGHVGLVGLLFVSTLPWMIQESSGLRIHAEKKTSHGASIRWFPLLIIGYVLARVAFSGGGDFAKASDFVPLTWLDRNGDLSRLLIGLPTEFIPEAAGNYLGVSIILIVLAACFFPALSRNNPRMASSFFLLFAISGWLTLEHRSLHRCTQDILEAATVQRYLDTNTLNLIGLIVLIWIGLAFAVLVHSCRVMMGSQRPSIFPVLLSVMGVWIWWASIPSLFLRSDFVSSWIGTRTDSILGGAISMLFCVGIVVQNALHQIKRAGTRLILLFLISLLVIGDLWPSSMN